MNVIVHGRTGQVYKTPDTGDDSDIISQRLGTHDWRMVGVQDLPPGPPLTVGQLRGTLEAWPDDMLVLVDNGQGWYHYIGEVVGPAHLAGVDRAGQAQDEWDSEATGYALPTLMKGRTFDSRDL